MALSVEMRNGCALGVDCTSLRTSSKFSRHSCLRCSFRGPLRAGTE